MLLVDQQEEEGSTCSCSTQYTDFTRLTYAAFLRIQRAYCVWPFPPYRNYHVKRMLHETEFPCVPTFNQVEQRRLRKFPE